MNANDPVSEAIDAVSETNDAERAPGVPNAVTSAMEALAPPVARRFGSGNFATVAGAVSLFRAVRSLRKGDRKRGLLRAGVGLFWVGVAVAQRRRTADAGGPDPSEVADTSPDVGDAVDPGGRDADHAVGTDVVDTTDADVEESDTAPEEGLSPEVEREAEDADVDQRDVVDTADAADAAESGSGDADSGTDEMDAADAEDADES